MRRKLIYLGGWGRSGSTVMANALGSADKIASVGELRYLWDRGVLENRRCGCSRAFHECEFWSRVFERSETDNSQDTGRRMTDSVGSNAVYRQLTDMFALNPEDREPEIRADLNILQRVYRAIFDVAEVDAVVDASKTPPYGFMLKDSTEFELYFIHLVRDPRAVAFSWSRKRDTKEHQEINWFPQYSSLKSAVYWTGINLLGLIFKGRSKNRYLRIRYEDFCSHPRAVLEEISDFCGISLDGIEWKDEDTIAITEQHSISGNPSRFRLGDVKIRPDEEWRDRMPAISRWVVSLLSLPLLKLFGYQLLSTRGDSTERKQAQQD